MNGFVSGYISLKQNLSGFLRTLDQDKALLVYRKLDKFIRPQFPIKIVEVTGIKHENDFTVDPTNQKCQNVIMYDY